MKPVAAAIVARDGKVLITRRKNGEKLSGHWEFPGGKVEDGETPQECLERELQEELGVRATAGAMIAESEYHYEHGSFRILAVLATIEDKEFSLTVHDKADWVTPGALLQYKLAPADVPIAKYVADYMKRQSSMKE